MKMLASKQFVGALVLLISMHGAYSTITGWTTPTIATATGTGALPAVNESMSPGTIATLVATSDAGGGVTAYAITGGQPTTGNIFGIDNSGVLTLLAGKAFDYETNTSYSLTITADDSGASPQGATITLAINDVNEGPPVFGQASETVVVTTYAAGTVITNKNATDPDTAASVVYSISAGNTNTDFSINSGSGIISVATGKTLSMTTTPSYTLTVLAVSAPDTATATVIICVGGETNCPNSSANTLAAGSLLASLVALAVIMW